MKVWVYESRKGEIALFKSFEDARRKQDVDNGMPLAGIVELGLEISGSEEEGHFYIDDGGSVSLTEVR